MARKPVVAGMFYEGDEESLKEQLEWCFRSELGAGKLGKEKGKPVLAAISPHAGYIYSGPCASYVYKELFEGGLPDTVILLGTNHTGMGTTSLLSEDWETPLGNVKADKELCKALAEAGIKDDAAAHQHEHSIEVQLPFLQHIYEKELMIVPISVSKDADFENIGKIIADVVKKNGKKACIIASSDFTHYGMNYSFFPFGTFEEDMEKDIKKELYEFDKKAIDKICELDSKGFIDYLNKTNATICGSAPISVLLSYCKAIGVKKGELLKYYTSGDISNDYSSAVGYGAIVFK